MISPRISAQVINVSFSGLMIATTTRLTPGERLAFRLIGDYRSSAAAVVRWCRLETVVKGNFGEILSLYRVGLALLHGPRRLSPTGLPS